MRRIDYGTLGNIAVVDDEMVVDILLSTVGEAVEIEFLSERASDKCLGAKRESGVERDVEIETEAA